MKRKVPQNPWERHFIGMNGLAGYLPNSCDVYSRERDAVDSLADRFDLTRRQKAELRRTGSVEIGHETLTVDECDCSTPWVHSDSCSDAAEWRRENMPFVPGRVEWFETSSYYGLRDLWTGREAVIGDGVDLHTVKRVRKPTLKEAADWLAERLDDLNDPLRLEQRVEQAIKWMREGETSEETLSPGTKEFDKAMDRMVLEQETFDAYFS